MPSLTVRRVFLLLIVPVGIALSVYSCIRKWPNGMVWWACWAAEWRDRRGPAYMFEDELRQ
jgi:hypothetical protein